MANPLLLQRCEAGEAEAIDELIAAHRPDAFRMALSLLDDPAEASEAAQDALLRAVNALRSYRGQAAYGISLTALIETNHLGNPPQLPHTALLIPAVPSAEQIMGHVCAPQFPAPDIIDPPIIVPPPDPPPFALQGDVAAQASPLGCKWLGVTGQAFSRDGTPLAGLMVQVEGGGMKVEVDSTAGRFVVQLAERPRTTIGVFQVQLRNTNSQPLSDWVTVDTFDDCARNLLIVNFVMQ